MLAKVLLLTADELLGSAYQARLAHQGWDVQRCTAARDGLAMARQWKPAAIVIDLYLPGMHGLDVLKWLRDVPWLASVRVVLLVERTVPTETLRESTLWGTDRHLFKDDASPGDLEACLAQLVPATPPVSTN